MAESAVLDPIDRLEQLLSLIPAERRRQHLGATLRGALAAAAAHQADAQRIEELSQLVPELRTVVDGTTRDALLSSLGALAAIGSTIASSSDEPALAEATVSINRDLPARKEFVELAFTNAWHSLIEGEFSSAGALGKVLERVPETRDIGGSMIGLERRANSLTQRLAPDQLSSLQALRAERTGLDARLEDLGLSGEVKAFLAAVSRGQATLATLTTPTREWLQEHNALGAFRVML